MELLGVIGPYQIILLILSLGVFLLFPIIALINILKNEFTGSNKVVRIIVVFLLPFLGAILYFIIGSKQKIK